MTDQGPSAEGRFDYETLLNTTVNLVPIGVLLFFVVLFAAVTPWPPNPWLFAIGHVLTLIPMVLLALLTYVAAKAFSGSEADPEDRGAGDASDE